MDRQSISDASGKSKKDRENQSYPEVLQMLMEPPMAPNADADANQGHANKCKYCANMHVLGLHPNRDKILCDVGNSGYEFHDNNLLGYYDGGAVYPTPRPYFSLYNRSQDSQPQLQQQMQHGLRMGYNARPRLPSARSPDVTVQPVPRSTDLLLGWAAPDPRNVVPQSRGHVHNLDLNLRLSSSRPVYPDLSVFAARGRPGEGDEQYEDDSGLDLSLKL